MAGVKDQIVYGAGVGGVRSHIVYDTVSDRGQGSNCVGWSEKERLKVMLCRMQ